MSGIADKTFSCALLRSSLISSAVTPADSQQPHLPSPPVLVAHGLTATGKTSIIKALLQATKLPFATINSRECITGRHLLEVIVASCLDAQDEHNGARYDRRPYARTENLSSLAVHLGKMLEGKGKFVLVLDGIDGQREAPPTLLPALARFGETVSVDTTNDLPNASYANANTIYRFQTSPSSS